MPWGMTLQERPRVSNRARGGDGPQKQHSRLQGTSTREEDAGAPRREGDPSEGVNVCAMESQPGTGSVE